MRSRSARSASWLCHRIRVTAVGALPSGGEGGEVGQVMKGAAVLAGSMGRVKTVVA